MVVVSLPTLWGPPLPIAILLLTLYVVSFFVFSFMHGVQTLGGKSIIVFLGITVVVTFLLEWLGTHFGVPFGHYFYTNRLGVLFQDVPVVIPVQWFNMLYVNYVMMKIIYTQGATRLDPGGGRDPKDLRLRRVFPRMVSGAITGGLFMVAWDFVNDPYMVGVGAWVWTNPGEFWGLVYYGVPLSNYIGWLFTSSVTLLLFELYCQHWRVEIRGVNQDWQDPANILILGPYLFTFAIQALNGTVFGIFSLVSLTTYGPIVLAGATMGLAAIATILSYRRLCRQNISI